MSYHTFLISIKAPETSQQSVTDYVEKVFSFMKSNYPDYCVSYWQQDNILRCTWYLTEFVSEDFGKDVLADLLTENIPSNRDEMQIFYAR